MKDLALFILTFFVLVLSGCVGVRFADETINRVLPDDFKNRNIYPETDIFKYKLDSLVGRILVCQPDQINDRICDCDLKITRIIKNGTTPETISPEQKVFSSKIDQGASAQGSYLAFAAKFSAEQVAEILITDSALVFIKDDDVPIEDLKQYVQSNPRVGQEKRFWIQGALLATIIQRELIKIDTDAEGVVGNVSGIKGGVYNHRGQESNDYRISLLMPDIDRDLEKDIKAFSMPDTKNHGILIRSIRGIERLPQASGN